MAEVGKNLSAEDLLLQLMSQKSAAPNPLIQGGLTAADMLGKILTDVLGPEDPFEKMAKWSLEQKKALLPKIQALPEGFSEGDVVKRQAASNLRFQPMFDKMAFNAARTGGRGAPQTNRTLGTNIASILAGDENQIRDFFTRLGTQRQQFKYGTLAGLVG